ncbi:sugar phosphate isomerase/epimerase [Natronoglomus mannanivorans]|uniref:Sugar phosphate isomerase/epimerase n=1 Tax=Natronoglomus mannanivorans TaxID=2979990 RepID=A0AAP3E3P6_9EURY|nr:sugar phosphate isomerase/epimerase [Halobacteria archaeon AArc-xg1-1]
MVRTAIQLQTLEEFPESLPETIARIGRTPLEGVELFGLNGSSPNAVADALEEADLEVIGAHVPIGRFERDYQNVVDAYATIGCDRLIVPLYDADAFASADGVAEFATKLSTLATRLAGDGFELLYHNHSFEFTQFANGDETAYDSLIEAATGVDFELDTGLAMYAGVDPIMVLSRHEGRIPIVHLTDSVPGYETTLQVELGAGELDVTECVEVAREAGVEWLVYEHGMTDDILGSLTHAATKLPMLSHGREAVADETSLSTIIDDGSSVSEDVL